MSAGAPVGLADTSLFIAAEADRPIVGAPPLRIMVSIVTIAELRVAFWPPLTSHCAIPDWRHFSKHRL